MYCTHCGSVVPPDAKFCAACGKAVENINASTAPSRTLDLDGITPTLEDLALATPGSRQKDRRSTVPRPWLRFWAKQVDIWLCAIGLGLLFGVMFPRWTAETNEHALGLLLLLSSVPIHALLLSVFGTTVGKALFNIEVTHKGEKLSFVQALGRESMLYLKGLGLGLPIVSLVTQVAAYNNLKEVGASSWDRDGGNIVTHRDPSVAGVVGAIAILGIGFALLLIGTLASQSY